MISQLGQKASYPEIAYLLVLRCHISDKIWWHLHYHWLTMVWGFCTSANSQQVGQYTKVIWLAATYFLFYSNLLLITKFDLNSFKQWPQLKLETITHIGRCLLFYSGFDTITNKILCNISKALCLFQSQNHARYLTYFKN